MSNFYDNKTDGVIHVQYKHVDNAAEDMRMQTEAIKKTVKALNEELAGLRAAWQGTDAGVYTEKQGEWNAAIDRLSLVLQNNSSLLRQISDTYKKHENTSTNNWSSVRIPGA
ncbi:WXG100 family type VII secretion target [Streptomyces sp. NPDC001744]|uniref:WXG100 family type VII secretion target n=1 Tax=Streptomyces sp. NPDC001744 TaxID=3364606 RepID=UPI0036BF0091